MPGGGFARRRRATYHPAHEARREQEGPGGGADAARPPPCSPCSSLRRSARPPPRAGAAAHLGAAGPPSYDRTVKCDLVERLPEPPELVIFGGSRAQRFEPSVAEELTGLPAFNFAVQNSRPEDAYAMARYLFWRAPGVKLRCLWALQATTLSDSPLHPGLLAEPRLSQFLPEYLLAEQREVVGEQPRVASSGRTRSSPRAAAWCATATTRGSSAASPSRRTLAGYLAAMVPRAAAPAPYDKTRAQDVLRAHAAALQPARRGAGAGDHAVPPGGARRVPRGRLGRQGGRVQGATSRACAARTASTCWTTRTSRRSTAARTRSTTARTSRPPMRAASSRRPSRTRRPRFR